MILWVSFNFINSSYSVELKDLLINNIVENKNSIRKLIFFIINYFLKEGSPTPVASNPPSTERTCPVIYEAFSDAKK